MATRTERVVLELEDRFTTGMARAAASAALLNKELDSLSNESVRTKRSMSDIDSGTQSVSRNAGSAGKEIDKLSGRVRILADAAAILGPALIPIGAVGVPAITGLASQLGFATVAAGTAVLAFQGVGGALKALNTAALDPTTKNLEAAQVALEGLSPSAQGFVAEVGNLLPKLKDLRDIAAAGLFPGLTEGLDALISGLPQVEQIVAGVSQELGSISSNIGTSLASDRFKPFLQFVADEAPVALGKMAEAAGNTGHAVAELFVATNPLNNDFLDFLVEATADLDRWASGLKNTQGFADFLAYVENTGPKVAAAFGAIADATIQILQAASPLGGPVLDGVKALADLVGAIANSDLGTPLFTAAAGLALFNRTLQITQKVGSTTFGGMVVAEGKAALGIRTLTSDLLVLKRESGLVTLPGKSFVGPLTQAQTAVTRLKTSLPAIGKTAALIAAVGVESTGAADKIGLTNTASLALAGTFVSPGFGTAVGAAAGLLLDAGHASDGLADSLHRADAAAKSFDASAIEASLRDLKKQRDDLANTTGVGDAFSDVFGLTRSGGLDKIDEKITKLKGQLDLTREQAQARLLRDGFIATATGIDTATQSTKDFQQSLQDLNDVLTGRASFRAYEQALDDFTQRATDRAKVLDQIRQEQTDFAQQQAGTGRDLQSANASLASANTPAERAAALNRIADIKAQAAQQAAAHKQRMADLKAEADSLKNSQNQDLQAGRDTQAALDNIATTALAFAQTLTGTARTDFLSAAREEFVKTAEKAGLAKQAAQDLADKVLGLKGVVGEPKIVLDADGAYHVIDTLQQRINNLKGKAIKIGILPVVVGQLPTKPTGPLLPSPVPGVSLFTSANGSTVPGSRLPYRDKVPALLAPGEEVISNRHGQADRNRDLLKAINANQLASGGTVVRAGGGQLVPFATSGAGSMSIDYDRLASAVVAARPLYGDVHISGDPTTFRRAMEQDQRMASLGGTP